MSGRVVHFEIPFDDGDRARGFYKELFGWQVDGDAGDGLHDRDDRPQHRPGTHRAGVHRRRHARAAAGGDRPARSSSWTSTASTRRWSGSAAWAAPRSSAKTPVGDMGFAAYFTDPEGNVMGLWETAPPG